MEFTFEQLPQAVTQIWEKLDRLEGLLQVKTAAPEGHADQLLTINEAAKLLSLSVPTIYGLVSKSEIPHSKKGKRLYFSRIELMEWIKEGRRKTTSEIQAEANTYLKTPKR